MSVILVWCLLAVNMYPIFLLTPESMQEINPKLRICPLSPSNPAKSSLKKVFLLFGSDGLCFSLFGWWWRWLHPWRSTLLHLCHSLPWRPRQQCFQVTCLCSNMDSRFKTKESLLCLTYVSLPWSAGPKSWLPNRFLFARQGPLKRRSAPGLAITFQS